MSKHKSFIRNFKKSNNLLKAGQSITLFKNTYTVMDSTDSYTLLKDAKGSPAAYPTKKLKVWLEESNITKADPASDPNTIAASPDGVNPITGKPSVPKTQKPESTEKLHAGMIRVDKMGTNGKPYHYWVHSLNGTRHDNPYDSEAQNDTKVNPEAIRFYHRVNDAISDHIDEEHKPEVQRLLNDFVREKTKYEDLKESHTQLADEMEGMPSEALKNINKKQSAYAQSKKKLFDALKKYKKATLV